MKCCSPGGKKLPGLQFLEGVVRILQTKQLNLDKDEV